LTAAGTKWEQDPVIKPGVYNNLPLSVYHSPQVCRGLSLSSSALRTIFIRSPAHYWCTSIYNPRRIEEPLPRHFALGRAMHHLAMGQTAFDLEFIVAPEYTEDIKGTRQLWNLRTKHAKQWVADAERQGKTWLTQEEIEQILGMSDALARDGFVINARLLRGHVERSAFWQDQETGIWLKIRPDVIPTDHGGEMIDLKTCSSVQWLDMWQAVEKHGYDQQFALMREVLGHLGLPFTAAALVWVEKKPPYCVRTTQLSSADLDLGAEKNRCALRQFAMCWNRERWPGPGGDRHDAETLQLPETARQRAAAKIAVMKEEEAYEQQQRSDRRNPFAVIQ
jgi:hypothetical protein